MPSKTKGKVAFHKYASEVLKLNPLKDPYVRDVIVYTPPSYSPSRSKGYTTVYGLSGYGGNGRSSFLNYNPHDENIEERMNRMISTGKCGETIVVLIDCFTRFGGNQYINSIATGRYEDYITQEIVPFVDKIYNTNPKGRAVFGKSSGGYGSIVLGMRKPEIFHAFADHSGDAAFEYCYLKDFPTALNSFREAGGVKEWFENYWNKGNRHILADLRAKNTLGMAAHYSPNPNSKDLGADLPFDSSTGEFRPKVWRRWLKWDPTRMIEKYERNLRKLKLIYVDCGTKDEENLIWGARIIHSKLQKMRIRHVYEEFEDGHMNIQYRYDVSLPKIVSALD
jgi:S-formylglutathione hydrolase FrmB